MSVFNRFNFLLLIIIFLLIIKYLNIKELFSEKSKCYSCENESSKSHPSNCYSCEDKKNNILLNRFPQKWG